MRVGQGKDMEDATVVSSPSFDAMMEARGETVSEEMTAVEAEPYRDTTAPTGAKPQALDPFAATVSSPSYDSRLEAMGLPVPEDDPAPEPQAWGAASPNDPAVPKTMVLSPQQWGLPAQPPPQPAPAQAAPQAPPAAQSAPWAPAQQPTPYASPAYAQPAPAARPASKRMSPTMMFLISAGATLVVFGTCAAGIIAYLVLRS